MPTVITSFEPAIGANQPVDGYVLRGFADSSDSATFTSMRNGNGTGHSVSGPYAGFAIYSSDGTPNEYSQFERSILCFNTQDLPDAAVITDVTLSLYGRTKRNELGSANLHVAGATTSSSSNLVNSDYQNVQRTSFGNISYASFNLNAYNDITFNSTGRAYVSPTAVTKLSIQADWDINNSFTGTWVTNSASNIYFSYADNSTGKPQLTVTYTIPNYSSVSGTLLLSGGVDRPQLVTNQSITGTLLLSGLVGGFIFGDTSNLEEKIFIYKVYDEDNVFLGVWDDVIDEPNWSHEINTTGSAITIYLARNSDSTIQETEVLLDQEGLPILDQSGFEIVSMTESRTKVGPGSNVNHNYRVDIFAFYGEVVTIDDNFSLPIQDDTEAYIEATVGAPNGIRRFTGFISEININYGNTENTQVQLMSYGFDLDQYPVVNALGETTVAFNSYDPSDIVREGLDQFTLDGINTFTTYLPATVESTGTVASYTFRVNTYKELLETAIKLAPEGWYFYIGLGDNLVRFKAKPTTADHTFYLGKHIKNLNLRSYIGDVVNDVIFTGGGDPALFKRYTDTPISGTRRGLNRVSDNRVTLEDSADILSQGEIDEKKIIQYRSTVDILDKTYDIESIELGDLVAFRNFDNSVDLITMQVVGLNYTPDIITLALDTLAPTVPKRLEELRKALNAQENEAAPVEPDV